MTLDLSELGRRVNAALQFLTDSFEATGWQGSAACKSYFRYGYRGGWAPAYPETTGYSIITLLDWAHLLQRAELFEYVERAADWLITQQLPNGLWCSGFAGGRTPSVFNTAMIVWGLSARYAHDADTKTLQSIARAAHELVACQDPDGVWRRYTYKTDFVPAYYTYACAALDAVARVISHTPLAQAAVRQLHQLQQQPELLSRPSMMGFEPDKPAFSHTVGYTLQGLSYWQDVDAAARDAASVLAGRLVEDFQTYGRLPGAYSTKPDLTFSCVTGDFQIGWALMRYFPNYAQIGLDIGQSSVGYQRRNGGFWGSRPAYGPYMPWKQPNWAVKFFLDWAYLAGRDYQAQMK